MLGTRSCLMIEKNNLFNQLKMSLIRSIFSYYCLFILLYWSTFIYENIGRLTADSASARTRSLLRSASREGRRSARVVLSPRGGFHRGGKERPGSSLIGAERTAGRDPMNTSGPLCEANTTWPARSLSSVFHVPSDRSHTQPQDSREVPFVGASTLASPCLLRAFGRSAFATMRPRS